MPTKIEICGLRNIKKLDFVVPDRGVWLLTAGNGAGKTTLLACLRRIGHPNAFQLHFPSSLHSDRLDNHSKGSVTYDVNGERVEYAYRGERWTPRPRSKANLFQKLGYSSVTYIGATAERITPRPEDFDTRHIRQANRFVMEAANQIFETNKFANLRTINLTRGTGNDAFVLALGGNPASYHSEKHFSLGELCVLKLLRLITQVSNNSMIIVDELEMALHPRAQVRLLNYLEQQAAIKSLTIIFSTHSVTLLKSADRKKIIYLDRQSNGEVQSVVGCYPTYAIGNIAADEETLPDCVLYVEDVFARDMVHAFFDKSANDKFQEPTDRPSTKVIPIGGFREVVEFLGRNKSVLPKYVKQMAVLDEDVLSENIATWKLKNDYANLGKFSKLDSSVKFLPFTPEVGLMAHIAENLNEFELALRTKFGDNQIRIGDISRVFDRSQASAALRATSKKCVFELIRYLSERTQNSDEMVRDKLCELFAQASWNSHRSDFMKLFGSAV